MGDRFQALAKSLNGKDRLEEWSIDELRHLVKRQPYFAPAQFLLLQKLRQSGTPEEAEAQYRKAVLYYHDPLLFEQFIASNRFYTEEWQHEEISEMSVLEEEAVPEVYEETEVADVIETENTVEETAIEEAPAVEEITAYTAVPDASPEIATTPETPAIVEAEKNEETFTTAAVLPIADEQVTEEKQEEEQTVLQPIATTAEVAPAAPALTFEPFHTVDYFASQGIKISQEELPKDKLGKQLKSFTEWLKTMKRLPAAQAVQNMESSAEKKVEALADDSVTESNVVTEAMAEVWLKQGATEKALDIYNKLSLLNPSKKAYFAAKVENLKQP
ncbi:MAG TPA: hypothetical protein VMR70_01965 [Flavisolibacter sp.]|nr:hypothetical protein [Flavisolibacter sp.]